MPGVAPGGPNRSTSRYFSWKIERPPPAGGTGVDVGVDVGITSSVEKAVVAGSTVASTAVADITSKVGEAEGAGVAVAVVPGLFVTRRVGAGAVELPDGCCTPQPALAAIDRQSRAATVRRLFIS